LENDDLSAISSTAQARGFLRIYAEFLGLNVEDLVPVKRPEEPVPTAQVPDALPDHPAAAAQDSTLKSKAEHKKFPANLLNLLKHHPGEKPGTEPAAEAAPQAANLALTESPPSVPIPVKEELAVAPVSPADKPVIELRSVETQSTPSIETTPTVKVSKKTGTRTRKTSIDPGKQNVVKKKESA
jgi:cytoskeletal protein RodZ